MTTTPTPPPYRPLRQIQTRDEFVELSKELRVRADWHEPDEQDVSARVEGDSFDNAGFWPQSPSRYIPEEILEMHVIFTKDGEDVATVNLATLCAWASDPEPRGTRRVVLNDEIYEEVTETVTIRGRR
jgi:hypothetical protein